MSSMGVKPQQRPTNRLGKKWQLDAYDKVDELALSGDDGVRLNPINIPRENTIKAAAATATFKLISSMSSVEKCGKKIRRVHKGHL